MKHTLQIITLATVLAAAGCSTPGLPRGARAVGGGTKIDWRPPIAGTAILVEKGTGRIIKTGSVQNTPSPTGHFHFDPVLDAQAILTALGPRATNSSFILYFVPLE